MTSIKLNYDSLNDILYAEKSPHVPSYGDDYKDMTTVFRSIESDDLTGIEVYDFKRRYLSKDFDFPTSPLKVRIPRKVVKDMLEGRRHHIQFVDVR
jgi:hypothetical protein